jgi:hypothetical protein
MLLLTTSRAHMHKVVLALSCCNHQVCPIFVHSVLDFFKDCIPTFSVLGAQALLKI